MLRAGRQSRHPDRRQHHHPQRLSGLPGDTPAHHTGLFQWRHGRDELSASCIEVAAVAPTGIPTSAIDQSGQRCNQLRQAFGGLAKRACVFGTTSSMLQNVSPRCVGKCRISLSRHRSCIDQFAALGLEPGHPVFPPAAGALLGLFVPAFGRIAAPNLPDPELTLGRLDGGLTIPRMCPELDNTKRFTPPT